MTQSFRLTDSTLRDGSHAVGHNFSPEAVRAVVGALDRAGVPVIEVSHGDGLGGSSFNYGFSTTNDIDLVRTATEVAQRAKIAVLLLPGIGVRDDLRRAAAAGASVARIATHCTEADISEQHLKLAKALGMETVGFLMMAHMIDEEALLRQALLMQSYGADCVYVVDSAGAMTMTDVRRRVSTLKRGLDCEVGMHAHNNLALAVGNSLAALEEGVDQLDACTTGLGSGAGNCPTELLVAACEKSGIVTGIDPLTVMTAAEDTVRPLHPQQGIIDRDSALLGYAGVYGSFLLHAKRAAARYRVDAGDILLELGRRKVVGGQEDMIIEVAVELSRTGSASRPGKGAQV